MESPSTCKLSLTVSEFLFDGSLKSKIYSSLYNYEGEKLHDEIIM